MHFFDISPSNSGPTIVCFAHFDIEMSFAPQRRAVLHLSSVQLPPHPPLSRAYFSTLRRHKSLEKQFCFATFLPFRSSASSFFWLFLFSDPLSSNLSLLSASALLCFSSVHTVGSLPSKLPSTIYAIPSLEDTNTSSGASETEHAQRHGICLPSDSNIKF